MADLNIERLQSLSQKNFSCEYPAGLRAATGLGSDPNGISKTLFGSDMYYNAAAMESLLGGGATGLTGGLNAPTPADASAPRADTPDTAALDILSDITISAVISPWNWTSLTPGVMAIKGTAAGQISYVFRLWLGLLIFDWTVDGTNVLSLNSGITPPGTTNGVAMGVRVAFDADNGAAGRTATFSTAPDGVNYSTFGTPATSATATSIFNSTSVLATGGRVDGTEVFQGIIHSMEVRNTAGTPVANPNFSAQAPGTTSFTDAAGLTWTLRGNAVIR